MRQLLDQVACSELLDLWLEAHAAIERLRTRPLGQALRRVPVPTQLSESIVALEAPRLLGADGPAASGREGNDLAITIGCCNFDVAVKGGASGWASLTSSDRRADLLVWLDYAPTLVRMDAAIEARVFNVRDFPGDVDRVVLARAPQPLRRASLYLGRRRL